ncbi:hypothetical protein LTR62_000324 [Meristemomyces frigidus]|uniref:Uncharacterized protein n=1 Tax=Meristemomyces frigidus TaxID=1508187 RepID=A0AAN7YT18_9PEZI|nr:hypothetical protein LTR62_000324 [Meristemomyces frigidus]
MPPKKPPPAKSADQSESSNHASSAGGATEISSSVIPISSTTTSAAGTPAPANPPSTNTPRAPSTRGRGATTRARVAAPKFAGRRSAAARAEAEKAEAERKRIETAGLRKAEKWRGRQDGQRGRGGGEGRGFRGGENWRGRGRGGYMGEGRNGGGGGGERGGGGGGGGGAGNLDVMSGPFGGGRVVSEIGGRRPMGGSSSSGIGVGGGAASGSGSRVGGISGGGGGGSSGIKQEPGLGGLGEVTMMNRGIKTEEGGDVSSDDEEGMKEAFHKMNVDDLGVIDLTADDDDGRNGQDSFAPVRIKREVHKDRTVGLNADATTTETILSNDLPAGSSDKVAPTAVMTTSKKGPKQKGKEVEITGASDTFHGAYSSSDETEQDPPIKMEVTEDGPQHIIAPPIADPPSSPESRRKGKEKIKAAAAVAGVAVEKPVHQTVDEAEEWERGQEELRVLYEELGIQDVETSTASTGEEGDAMVVDGQAEQTKTDRKADKVYLFQFPPVLPDLMPVIVKPDPEATVNGTDAAEAMDVGGKNLHTAKPIPAAGAPGTRPPLLPSGAVGKLRIHRSGKASLDWGGTKLALGMGTAAGFLQDVMVTGLPDKKKKSEGKGGGAGDEEDEVEGEKEKEKGWAAGMGQVKGKFVVVPDWGEVFGG